MPTPLSDSTVAIVGLGLMGGSLGLALAGRCARRVGVTRRIETGDQAVRMGVVDVASIDLATAVGEADIVVLAMPVRTIIETIPVVAETMRPGALLIDLGSTKASIVEAMNALPSHVTAVGGHPMCGKENSGLEHADATLYEGATFVLTPTRHSTEEALERARELAETVGANPLVHEADLHDRAAAYISHLPFLLAAALMSTEMCADEAGLPVRAMAASGFRDATRLAAGDVTMMLDTLLTNRRAVAEALDGFERQLAEARGLLDEPGQLEGWLEAARRERRSMFA